VPRDAVPVPRDALPVPRDAPRVLSDWALGASDAPRVCTERFVDVASVMDLVKDRR
jgi:hypothetical protein